MTSMNAFFERLSSLHIMTRKIIPEVPDYGVSPYSVPVEKSTEEVHASVPTASSSKEIATILKNYMRTLTVSTTDLLNVDIKSHRPVLTKLELFCIVSDSYGLTAAGRQGWDILFTYSNTTRRFVDASYALVNQLLCHVIDMESSYPKVSVQHIYDEVDIMKNKLSQYRYLLDATDEAVRSDKLPTAHSQFQCVMVDVGRAYLENYGDWSGYSVASRLIPTKHVRIFAGKSFTSICARGYYYWNHLRARCIFGATGDSLSPEGESFAPIASESTTSLPNPDSILYQAVVVRMYGRTLVHYLQRYYEEKIRQLTNAAQKDMEDKENIGMDCKTSGEVVPPELSKILNPKCPVWTDCRLSDGDLLNYWLGIRLMLLGSLQATELYTMHGTIREAQAYQIELLRIGQCFHLLKHTQVAFSLMAHVDMFAQRRWAFAVHLRQLHHIATSKMSLDEMYQERMHAKKLETQRPDAGEEDADAIFLHTLLKPSEPVTNSYRNNDDCATAHGSSQSAGQNPLLAANNNGFADVFPCSPPQDRRRLRQQSVSDKASRAFPSVSQLTSLITGKVSCPSWPITDRPRHPEELDNELQSVGGLSLTNCVQRVLHATNWPWFIELSDLVREQLLPVAHQLPVLLPSRGRGKLSSTATAAAASVNGNPSLCEPNRTTTEELVAAFSALACSPDRCLPDRSSVAGRLSPPPAPRRMADRRNSPISDKRTGRVTRGQVRRMNAVDSGVGRLAVRSEGVSRTHLSGKSRDSNSCKVVDGDLTKIALKLPPTARRQSASTESRCRGRELKFYVDKEDEQNDTIDPVETCPSLIGVSPRPRNLRLATRWAARHQRVSRWQPSPCQEEEELAATTLATVQLDEELARRLQQSYLRLAAFPVPNLLRPVCHWLGCYWLSRGNQAQAGRFFSQAVGISATTLYNSILSSRLYKSPPTTPAERLHQLRHCYHWSKLMAAPNHPFARQEEQGLVGGSKSSSGTSRLRILQFCLVDELVAVEAGYGDGDGAPGDTLSSHQTVAFGVGARTGGYLVVTKFTGISPSDLDGMQAESRVIHGFTCSGLKVLDTFDELQVESLDSMLVTDRVRYWRMRYALDERMEALLNEIRTDWFTPEDIKWLFDPTVNPVGQSTVLVLDRRLAHLPWEWILWDMHKPFSPTSHVPTLTRNFSVPLVMAQLASRAAAAVSEKSADGNMADETAGKEVEVVEHSFNPHQMFYVVNPEANLSATQQTFQPLFEELSSHWRGVLGRVPSVDEVNSGFVDHDIFMYLGHGNGSRFLLHTFNQGLTARAAGLVLGCSSGRPNGEGRHEFYSSLFNHLIGGCPFVAGLLWDVTDRDLDRFTVKLLKKWLFQLQNAGEEGTTKTLPAAGSGDEARPTLATCMTQARLACKLKNLVGKSMIVYGLPAEPSPNSLIPLPASLFRDLVVDKPKTEAK